MRRAISLERGPGRVIIPGGLAVLTWLVVLLTAGFLVRLDSLSLATVVPLLLFGFLLWPVLTTVPWRTGLSGRVVRWARRNRRTLAVAGGLAVLTVLPVTPDPVAGILELPYRGSGILFGASLFYREHLGPAAGTVVFRSGQWYFLAVWLHFLAKGLVGVARRVPWT